MEVGLTQDMLDNENVPLRPSTTNLHERVSQGLRQRLQTCYPDPRFRDIGKAHATSFRHVGFAS